MELVLDRGQRELGVMGSPDQLTGVDLITTSCTRCVLAETSEDHSL